MIEQKLRELTPEQELFCRAYTREGDTFSNATSSYAEAYGYDLASLDTKRELDENNKEILGTSEYDKAEAVCANSGSRLLRKDYIIKRKNELLALLFDEDSVSDARLQQIIIRGSDSNAINAIKHRSELKARVTKKLDITTSGRPLANLSDEELQKLASE
jgi:hypothetical protein